MGKINDILKKKGKKPQLLQKNAFEAAAAGAQATGINLNPDKEEDDGPKKVANPITMSASSPSPLQFNTFQSQGRFNYKVLRVNISKENYKNIKRVIHYLP